MEVPPPLRDLLARQDNVVATWQMPVGLRRNAARAARLGLWTRLSRHTLLASPAPASIGQQGWAAVLHFGRHARLSGRAALVLHGWNADFNLPFDVAVPHTVQTRAGPPWTRVHRLSVALTGPTARPCTSSSRCCSSGFPPPTGPRRPSGTRPGCRAADWCDGSHSLNIT